MSASSIHQGFRDCVRALRDFLRGFTGLGEEEVPGVHGASCTSSARQALAEKAARRQRCC